MNRIFNYAASAPQYFSTAFKEVVLPQLTEQQKKILVISSIAFSILTAIFIVSRCCFLKNTPSSSPSNSPYIPPKGGFKKQNTPPNTPPESPSSSPYHSPKTQSKTKVDPQLFGTFVPKPTPNPSTQYQASVFKDPWTSKPYTPTPTFIDPWASKPVDPWASKPVVQPVQPNPFASKPYQPTFPPVITPVESKKPATDPTNQSMPRIPKEGLDGTEDAIQFLLGDLHLQQQMVQVAHSTPPPQGDDMDAETYELLLAENGAFIEETEARLKELEQNLEDLLAKYPEQVGKYLGEQFARHSHKDLVEIHDHVVRLSGIMETNAKNTAFILNCLNQIDAFLTKSLFTSPTEVCLQEQHKNDFIVLNEFLAICDKHINGIAKTDPQLCRRLKIKLANLPLVDHIDPVTKAPKDRCDLFPNAHLSEQEQVAIMADHFQDEEDRMINALLSKIQGRYFNFTERDYKRLAKMISDDRGTLSSANKKKLQEALGKAFGIFPPIGKYDAIFPLLKSKQGGYNPYGHSYSVYPGYGKHPCDADVLNLCKANKAKTFFANQIGLPEDQVQIPRWYHATKHHNIELIVNSGQVNVEHKQAYKGAWVSNRRESEFGGSVFCFTHRISKLDPNVFIGYEKGGEGNIKGLRWRGLQNPIPLADKATAITHISLFGLYEGATQAEKQKVIKDLKNKGHAPVIVTIGLLDYIQKEILKTIGSPNLTAKWWGKADEGHLDKQYSKK